MTNPNELVTAMYDNEGFIESKDGLTKREYFAAMAMSGIMAMEDKKLDVTDEKEAWKMVGETSVKIADALIDALNKKK